MNKRKLRAIMLLNGDTYKSLSEYLKISKTTFTLKINESSNYGFNQKEILKIKEKYNLNSMEVDEIFFSRKVS